MDHLTFYSSFVSFENWQVVCGGAFALVVLAKYFNSNNTKPFPPGPRGWPVIGNVLDIPFEYPWKVYRQWGREASKFSRVFESSVDIHWNRLGYHQLEASRTSPCRS